MSATNDEADGNLPEALQGGLSSLEISDSAAEVERQAADMQQRCRLLLDELETFQAHLKQLKKETQVELRMFKSGLQAEMKLIDKLATADPNLAKTSHALRSSNLSFYAAVWSIAKTCRGLNALSKRFYWLPGRHSPITNSQLPARRSTDRHRLYSAVVDIVSQDGLEWIKVSSITEKRIIWDLAKAGWAGESSGDESEESEEDENPEGILKQIQALLKASKVTRYHYQNPKIRLVLPKIKAEPDTKEVANVLRQIRKLGVIVQTAEDVPSEFPAVADVLDRIATDRFESFSETLNVDCTILLAFASDLSHGRVQPEDWHNKAISRQIEMENEDQLLPSSLWPACGTRKLFCTSEASVRMQEIVEIIGTETERSRTALLLGLGKYSHLSREEVIEEFQKLSDYTIPPEWKVPIEVADVEMASMKLSLPPAVAEEVSKILTSINQSVFLFGWSTGRTTISSNRTVAKEIETTIEQAIASSTEVMSDVRGPDIWLTPTSRSLVGKEKQRRGFIKYD